MKHTLKKTLSAAVSAVLVSCPASAVFPASAYYILPIPEEMTYKSGYVYKGDIDGNGKIDDDDVQALELYIEGFGGLSQPFEINDVNSDGRIDDDDADLINDFVNSIPDIQFGDVCNSNMNDEPDGITNLDVIAIKNYIEGNSSKTQGKVSPFIEYLGDSFNRGDGLTEEDYMVILCWIENHDVYRLDTVYNIDEWVYEDGSIRKSGDFRSTENSAHTVSVSLDGTLGLNFYVHLTENADKAVLSGPNGDITISRDEFPSLYARGSGYGELFRLTYPITSVQAQENVTLRLFDSGDNELSIIQSGNIKNSYYSSASVTSSVSSYLDNYRSQGDTETDKLVSALGNYCKAAENYFKGANNTIEGISSVSASNLKDATSSFATSNMNKAKLSLVLNSATSMRIYYPSTTTPSTVKCYADNDTVFNAVVKDGYIEIPNIPAHMLAAKFTVSVNNVSSIVYPLNYVKRVLNNTDLSDDDPLVTVSKALYVYAQAAKAYTEDN